MEKDLIFEFLQQKSIFRKNVMNENMFYDAKGIKLNNKIINIKNLSKLFIFIV